MKTIYKAAPGAQFPKKKAQEYGEELLRIKREVGRLTPEATIEAAESKDSILHDYFEWNDKKAGHNYRIEQARDLIGHLIVVKQIKGEDVSIRAFFNVKNGDDEGSDSHYVTIVEVARNKEYHEQVIRQALGELIRWKERYANYKELDLIFGAIESVQKELAL